MSWNFNLYTYTGRAIRFPASTCCIRKRAEVSGQADSSFMGVFFKCARIGERLSPYVSLACLAMAVTMLR